MVSKITKLIDDLSSILEKAKDPVLCWSGGKDSTLLLSLILNMGYNIPVLIFPYLWNEYQKQFITKLVKHHKLVAFFYTPNRLHYDPPFVVSFYNLHDIEISVIADHIQEDSCCGLDIGRSIPLLSPKPAYHWDVTFVGTKSGDSHPLVKQPYNFNTNKVVLPLWDWSDQEVLKATSMLGYQYDRRIYDNNDEKADTGNFVGCLKCLGVSEVFCPKEHRVIQGISY